MMIPVRVKTDAALPIVGGMRTLGPDHPLIDEGCPACGEPLATFPLTVVVLVLVGIPPEDRAKAYGNGGAVAVHAECAGFTTEQIVEYVAELNKDKRDKDADR